MKKLLQIFILARDRISLFEEALDSILVQDYSEVDIEIVISDNSETDAIQNLLNSYPLSKEKFKYIRHLPPLRQDLHFQYIIDHCSADYLVMFHDDDIMHPDYVKVMYSTMKDSNFSALGCNAFQFRGKFLNNLRKTHKYKSLKIFNNKKDFLERYLVGNEGVAPYPGYLYKTEFVKKIPLTTLRSSFHGDVVFLSSLLDFGLVAWVQEPLMYYRIHSGSSSSKESVLGRKLLIKYMISQGIDPLSTPVFLNRYLYYLNWFIQQGPFFINISKWRYRIVAKFLLLKSINVMKTSYFWLTILRKLKILKH